MTLAEFLAQNISEVCIEPALVSWSRLIQNWINDYAEAQELIKEHRLREYDKWVSKVRLKVLSGEIKQEGAGIPEEALDHEIKTQRLRSRIQDEVVVSSRTFCDECGGDMYQVGEENFFIYCTTEGEPVSAISKDRGLCSAKCLYDYACEQLKGVGSKEGE